MSLQHRGVANVVLAGQNLGTFDVFEGGETSADATKHRFGGDEHPTSLGGPKETGNITVRRVYRNAKDQAIKPLCRAQVGNPDNAVIGFQDLDDNQRAFGRPDTYRGSLVRFKPPEQDSSSNDKKWIELEFEISGGVS